ncbi:hypothetical protein PQO03_18980 [Lentisphaera profundi]|uniref:PhoD-like phosphatase metallophosphatase domain-containing protein n=1 Tax=Lentisphaera profundi TaxID=1658616 RepID=A0ABY7VYX4_9BACT|nr:hypothetical protein [Lentisphaera profundi]WDE97914.1 hypothetical protein PQO03_18980 [Lentisphaera profundi]
MCRVLSGPHLRRVEKDFISVQIILEEDLDLTLQVFKNDKALTLSCDVRKIPFANKIFFYIFRATLQLDEGCTYHYDIINKQESIISDLSLSLDGLSLHPSFEFGSERILTGSCRKLSSHEEDCLPKMLDAFTQGGERPQMLILTGDQVYSDDISDGLFAKITELVKQYGFPQTKVSNLTNRKKLCKSIGLTSRKSKNHLLSLGEFIILYLLSWSDELWEKNEKIINRSDLTKVRKLFANVPVYMQMDDHDVSDDLKINNFWLENINECGFQVLANAYAVGYLFQSMGNYGEYGEYDQVIDSYVGLQSSQKDLSSRLVDEADWSFSLSIAARDFIFLDTRNHRYGGETAQLPAGLLKLSKIDELLRDDNQNNDCILVSPSPIYAYEAIERLQSLLAFLPSSVSLIDREGWHAADQVSDESNSLRYLEKNILNSTYRKIIILSGDVHYSFARKLELNDKSIIQLVVSSLKNKPPVTILARLWFRLYNSFSRNGKYLTSCQGSKILHYSNYCYFKLESEIKISMYSRGIEHKFNPNVENDELAQ